jgi:hypothetical protein
MNINLKQSLKKEVLQYMRDNEINLELVESIDFTKEEMKKGVKEGSIEVYCEWRVKPKWECPTYLAMKISNKVIPVQEKVDA